jgi:hypothetical protein
VTVYLQDIGLERGHWTKAIDDWWYKEVVPWMNNHIHGNYNLHEAGIWFAEPQDAMLFKLTWAGTAPT